MIFTRSFQRLNMSSIVDHTKLRDELLEYIYDEEHSNLPIRYFRTTSHLHIMNVTHISVETRTKLGAIIAFINWVESSDLGYSYWPNLVNERKTYESVEKFIDTIVNRMVDGVDDKSVLIETQKSIILKLLIGDTVKSARKE